MSFLLPLASSIFSSPLIQGALGSLASGAISTIKGAATNFLTNGLSQVTNTVNKAQEQVSNYDPEWARPPPSNLGKRVSYQDMDDDYEDVRPKRRVRNRSRSRPKPRQQERPVYNPDLITDFEE